MGDKLRAFYVSRGKGAEKGADWGDWEQEVREEAERAARRKTVTPTEKSLENLVRFEKGQEWTPPSPDRRCTHVKAASGVQCRNWAMVGATRCHFHGGYRQNPRHKATVAKLGLIESQTAHKQNAKQVYAEGRREAREAAKAILKEAGLGAHNSDVLEGMNAHDMDDGGKAWRRWQKSVRTRSQQSQAKRDKHR